MRTEGAGVLFIPGEVPSKKNSKRILRNFKTGAMFIASSENALRYRKYSAVFYKSLRTKFLEEIRNRCQEGVLYVGMYFARVSERVFDYNNISQSVCDMMVENQWVGDDCARVMVPVFLGYFVDRGEPGVYIVLMGEEYEMCVKKVLSGIGL